VESHAAPQPDALGPARLTWAAVSLADKLDTLVGLFLAGERPTGSRDPFGLRRQAHGIIRILLDAERLTGRTAGPSLGDLCASARAGYSDVTPADDAWPALEAFARERLEHVLEQRGASAADVRAATRHRGFAQLRPADLERNVAALAEFSATPPFRKLAEAFKRVRNIARELEGDPAPAADLRKTLKEPAEVALLEDLQSRRTAIEAVANGGAYTAAYAEAAGFEATVARFFNEVFVMAEDPALRQARLGLMKQLEQLMLQLGDISEIVASE
jgi:glycyl-tRNA synthetase beta chain